MVVRAAAVLAVLSRIGSWQDIDMGIEEDGGDLGVGTTGIQHASCPEVGQGEVGACVEECEHDEECQPEGKLCCSNGCGHECRLPGDPSKKKLPAEKFVIMAVMVNNTDAAAVVAALPDPDEHHKKSLSWLVLQSSGIIII